MKRLPALIVAGTLVAGGLVAKFAPSKPAPIIASVSPKYVLTGNQALITISGSGFTQRPQLYINSIKRFATVVSSTQMTSTLLATDVASPTFLTLQVITNNGSSNAFSYQVCAPLKVTTTSLPAGKVGQPYSFQLQATGGCL